MTMSFGDFCSKHVFINVESKVLCLGECAEEEPDAVLLSLLINQSATMLCNYTNHYQIPSQLVESSRLEITCLPRCVAEFDTTFAIGSCLGRMEHLSG